MPQHIQGVNIIKNASVIVSSIARPNNEANYIKLTEQTEQQYQNLTQQSKISIIAQKMQSVQNAVMAKKSR